MPKYYSKNNRYYKKKKRRHVLGWILLPIVLLITLLMIMSALFGQVIEHGGGGQEEQRHKFLNEIGPAAKRIQEVYDVPASIIMAQAALESNFGTAELAAQHHNLFGVKASPGMKQVALPTKEFVDDEWITKHEPFRSYDSWTESLIDHAQLIRNGTMDKPHRYDGVNTSVSYQKAAEALVDGQYATDPNYADKLISMIETYDLQKYDKETN